MPDIGTISTAIDLSRKFIGLVKDLSQFATDRNQNDPAKTKGLREILLGLLTAIDETERYATLAKKYQRQSLGKQMGISEMWKNIANALAMYIKANDIMMNQQINLKSLQQACDFKAKGWLNPENVDESDIAMYRASLKELRKTINNILKSMDNQIFREER